LIEIVLTWKLRNVLINPVGNTRFYYKFTVCSRLVNSGRLISSTSI